MRPSILLLPLLFYPLTLFALLPFYGGHRLTSLYNPYCRHTLPPNISHVFLHITDLHVSALRPTSIPNLEQFRSQILPSFPNSTLLVSGDLVNGVVQGPFGSHSEQLRSEWQHVQNFLSSVPNPTLISPGNHDTFGSPHNLPMHHHPLVHIIDATLKTTPHRPLNFFGNATTPPSSIITLAHYPFSIISTNPFPPALAHLSGHLHTLFSVMPQGMQVVDDKGSLHLHLPDLVDNAKYRLLVIDQGALSFADFHLNDPDPFVITNPPRAALCSRGAGTLALQSTHIRVYGSRDFRGGMVRIDDEPVGELQKEGNVWLVEWTASQYDDGKAHELTVGDSKPFLFSLDGHVPDELWWHHIQSAIYVLSRFDRMAFQMCNIGFAWITVFLLPHIRNRNEILLATFSVLLRFGPFLVVPNFSDGTPGAAGLMGIMTTKGRWSEAVDVAYFMSSTVLYGTLLPVTFMHFALRRFPHLRYSVMTKVCILLYNLRSLKWTIVVLAAYGYLAALLSPSCLGLFLICLFSSLTLIPLRKEKH